MHKYLSIILIILVLVVVLALAYRAGIRSGVTDAQVSESLPGDDLLAHPWITIDRAARLPASATSTWPWIVQLGKDRAGWYAPQWLENLLQKHSAASIEPAFQNLQVGDVIPDWGGGSLKVLEIVPDQYIVYGSLHSSATASSTASETNYQFIWTLILEDSTASSTTFHLRLRIASPTSAWIRALPAAPIGLIDYATDVVLFQGLKEKLQSS